MTDLQKETYDNITYNINGLKVYEVVIPYEITATTTYVENVMLPLDCPLGVVGYRFQGGSNTYVSVCGAYIGLVGNPGRWHAIISFYANHTGSGTITLYVLYHDNADYDTDFKTTASDFA